MNYLLNLLSILVYFINRFWYRKKQTVPFNSKFWINDNWPEFSITLLLNLIFMLLLSTIEVRTALENLPPAFSWIYYFGIPGLSVAIGLGLSWAVYELLQWKIKDFKHNDKN